MEFMYILFHADSEENVSSTLTIEDEERLTEHFCGEEEKLPLDKIRGLPIK